MISNRDGIEPYELALAVRRIPIVHETELFRRAIGCRNGKVNYRNVRIRHERIKRADSIAETMVSQLDIG